MPIPISETLADHGAMAITKDRQARSSPGRYFVASMLAGAFVGVAVLLLIMATSAMLAAKSPETKLVQGSVFGIALTLVVFAGAELFTGNVMVMVQGLLAGQTGGAGLSAVWAGSLLGNLAGSVAFAAIVNASGVLATGALPGKAGPVQTALAGIIRSKDALTGGQLFWRSVLCNFLVCLALWMAARTRSDAAKLICLWWALLAFIVSGFEHSIANMTVFSLGALGHVEGATWGMLWRNLLWTVPGNVVGGGLMVGAAYAYVADRPTKPVVTDIGTTVVVEVDSARTQFDVVGAKV
jgi:nitrite transporter NirC